MAKYDLDALTPEPVKIKFNGQEIVIQQPKLGDILLMTKYAQRLEKLDELDDATIEETANKLQELLGRIIPEVSNTQLTLVHLMQLPMAVLDASTPKTVTKDGREITPDPKAE